jgi:hypothetical protein
MTFFGFLENKTLASYYEDLDKIKESLAKMDSLLRRIKEDERVLKNESELSSLYLFAYGRKGYESGYLHRKKLFNRYKKMVDKHLSVIQKELSETNFV